MFVMSSLSPVSLMLFASSTVSTTPQFPLPQSPGITRCPEHLLCSAAALYYCACMCDHRWVSCSELWATRKLVSRLFLLVLCCLVLSARKTVITQQVNKLRQSSAPVFVHMLHVWFFIFCLCSYALCIHINFFLSMRNYVIV